MDGTRLVLLILIIIFIFATAEPQQPAPRRQLERQSLLEIEHHDLDLLNSTRYGDFDPVHDRWINSTGLRKHDGYAWDLLPKVRTRAKEQVDTILKPYRDVNLGRRYRSSATIDVDYGGGVNQSEQAGLEPSVPFYQNITGLVNGKWVRSAVTAGYKVPVLYDPRVR